MIAIVIRSALFNFLFITWTFVAALLLLVPTFVLPRRVMQWGSGMWAWGILGLAAIVIPLRFQVRGREHIPTGPAIIASKHQSAWETFVFHALVGDPVYILKRELFFLPLAGWLMWRTGMIGIDRSKAAAALKAMVRGTAKALAGNRQVVIFPEGTRTTPGTVTAFQPGVALLYQNFDVPVIPVALNSGVFWGRHSFVKRPGTVVIEFLPPMARGLSKRAFIDQLRDRIEEATGRLVAETGMAEPVENFVDKSRTNTADVP